MENILFYTDHFKSHMTPTFELAQSLNKAGYNICYFGIADAIREISKYGFETYTIFEHYFPKGRKKNLMATNKSPLKLILEGELDELISKYNPKLIVIIAFNPLESLLLYYKYKVPMALFWPYLPKGNFNSPENSPYVELMRNNAELLIYRHLKKNDLLIIENYIKSQGYKLNNSQDLLRPFEYFAHFIACSKEIITQQVAFRKKEIYLGPCIWEQNPFESSSDNILEWLSSQKTQDKKFIYSSTGTLGNALNSEKAIRILKTLISCMGDERLRNYNLIITAGVLFDSINNLEIPNNVHLYKWLPQVKILKYMSLAIFHGGFGSIKECIDNKVPMALTPLGSDQFENSRKVVYHGLGVEVDVDSKTSEQICGILHNTLNDDRIALELEKMKAFFDKATQENNGVEYIQRELETSR